MELLGILMRLRRVSDISFEDYKKKNNKQHIWSVYEQLNHTHSEVSEAYDVLRRPENYLTADYTEEDMKIKFCEELWDVVFSALTNAHVGGVSDYDLKRSFFSTLEKIEKRVGISPLD